MMTAAGRFSIIRASRRCHRRGEHSPIASSWSRMDCSSLNVSFDLRHLLQRAPFDVGAVCRSGSLNKIHRARRSLPVKAHLPLHGAVKVSSLRCCCIVGCDNRFRCASAASPALLFHRKRMALLVRPVIFCYITLVFIVRATPPMLC